MPHEKLRSARENLAERRKKRKEKRENLRKRAGATKRKIGRAVFGGKTAAAEQEVRESAKQAKALAQEIAGPAVSGAKKAKKAAGSFEEKAGKFDEAFAEVRGAEQDILGKAGRDLDVDLEIVDDMERGEPMEGMGDVGMDTTFDEAVDRDTKGLDVTFDDPTEDRGDIDDILGDL